MRGNQCDITIKKVTKYASTLSKYLKTHDKMYKLARQLRMSYSNRRCAL